MALSQIEKGVEGNIQPPHKIQPLHTFDPSRWHRSVQKYERQESRWDRLEQLGGTDVLGLRENIISVAPIASTQLDRSEAIRQQRGCQANSVGPIAHLGEIEILQQATESLQGHLGETETRIGVTKFLGFLVVAMSSELGGAGQEISVGLSLTSSFGHIWK